jgi:hypothetical protein
MLAEVALGLLEEGGEGVALLLPLDRCIKGGERVLMLAALVLRRHYREPSGHIRRKRRFSASAIAALAASILRRWASARAAAWSFASLAAAALLSAAMSSCAARSGHYVSNDARIALCSVEADTSQTYL